MSQETTEVLPEEILDEEENQEELEDVISDKKVKDEKAIDTSIKINTWGYVFLILFAAIFGYLFAAYLTGLPPFILDELGLELVDINETVLVIFIVAGLLCLGLGFYFGWMRKKPETTVTITTKEIDTEETPKENHKELKTEKVEKEEASNE